jgi:hypothetical protein
MIWLKSRLALVLGALTAFLALLGAVYGKGRKDANTTRDTKDMRAHHDTRKRIDKVVRDTRSDDDLRKWLHERSKR